MISSSQVECHESANASRANTTDTNVLKSTTDLKELCKTLQDQLATKQVELNQVQNELNSLKQSNLTLKKKHAQCSTTAQEHATLIS